MTRSRKKHDAVPLEPVSEEFRARCHAMVDRALNDHPGTNAALFAFCWATGHDACTEPSAFRVKAGIIEGLYLDVHPELIE